MMETRGTLAVWKQDAGYGFIRTGDDQKDVFVHVRDFGNITRKPRVGDTVVFQPMQDENGRLRAAGPRIEGVARLPARARLPKQAQPLMQRLPNRKRLPGRQVRAPWQRFTTILVSVAILSAGGPLLLRNVTNYFPRHEGVATAPPADDFHCEGKQHCREMSSCAEARYYLENCPNTAMDGDGDGIPCERQWCD